MDMGCRKKDRKIGGGGLTDGKIKAGIWKIGKIGKGSGRMENLQVEIERMERLERAGDG